MNLCFGTTEELGLRCRMHGWVYDIEGNVLETPGEPAESTLKERVHHPSYPAQELGGVIFIYMGPPPVPLLPRFHFLVAEGWRRISFQGFTNCNWLQAVENGMDPIHPAFLHKDQWPWRAPIPDRMEFVETEWSVISRAHRPPARGYPETESVHGSMFPAMSMALHEAVDGLPPASVRFSTPIDDTHTAQIRVMYSPVERERRRDRQPAGDGAKNGTGSTVKDWSGSSAPSFGIVAQPYKEYLESGQEHPQLGYSIPVSAGVEDHTVIDSMGPIVDRHNENLLTIGDIGVVRLRQRLLDAIEDVRAGRDPRCVIRDAPENEIIVITVPE